MGDDVKKIYDELSSLGRVNVPYDQFAQAYTSRADYKEKIDLAYGEIFPELKKKDDSQSGSPLLSGVSSSEFRPGGTIDINGEEVSYDDFLKRFVKGEEVYGAPIEAEEVVVTPAPSTAENLWNSTKIGLMNLQEAIYSIPRTLYQIAAIPQNIIADQAQIPELRANYDEFLNMIPDRVGATQNPLALIDDIAKVTSADIEALAAKKAQDGATITELYNTKGFGAAAERTAEYVLESLPISLAAIAGGGAGLAAGEFSMVASGVTAGTLSFPSHKKELEKYDLQDWESDGLALILSGLEAAFEGPANKVIASQTAKILLESGEDAAKNFARDASFAIFNRALVPFATTAASGSASEMATTYSQNVVKKLTVNPELNVFEGVADAGIVGFVSDPLITSVPLSVQMVGNTADHLKTRRQRKRAIEEIEVALQDETLPAEVIDNLQRSRDALVESYNADGMKVNEMYESMSSEDKSSVTEISKKLLGLARALGRKNLSEAQKQAIESTFTELSMQKADIESKYETPVSDDSENQIGLPSEVLGGQEPVQAQPVEGAGQEAPQAGGVLQVPIQEGEVEPTWLGKPMGEVVDQRLPEELTEQELMDLAKQVYGDVFIEPGQLQDIQKVYSLGRKVAKGDMNFTDEEINLYGEYGDVIDQISNSIKNQMATENNRARTRQQANAIANKALKGDEFTEEDNAFYAENQEEVEAAMYEARAAQGRAASQMPEIVRQEQKKRAPKKVTMTDKSLVRQRIQDMIEGARGAVNEVAALQESIKEMINELTTAGAITAKQASALVKAALDVRVNRPSSAKRFADKYEAIMKGAALEVQKNKAKDLRTKLGKIGKQRFTPFNIKDVITEFLRVNPESVDDIGVYNEMAEALMSVARSRKIDKASIERVLPYIDGQDSLARALGRKPLKSYAQEARLRGYMNEVIMQYVQDQFEQARDERMDKIAEDTGVSREELEETLRDMSEDEILSGYYDAAGNNITMEDGSRRTVERDIVERMKASLGKAGIDTTNMSDREIQDLFARTQEQKKGSRNEKYQSLINAKLAIINTEGLSPTLSSARYRDVSGLSARELSALNSMLDNIINNGSQANAGNAKILLEKTGRVEQIKEVLERKKLSNFTEKLLGIVGSKEWNKRPVFFRFDQIIEQIAGRGDIGSLLDELGYDNYRVSEAAADVILVNSRKFINDVTARLNKKYGTDVNSAQNQARATILQLFVQARNNMTKANESLIVNSIIENLKATSRAYTEGDAVDVQIATTIDEFLTQLGTPSYVDNVVGFAMLDNVEAKAKLFAGPAMIEYVDAWKGVHEQHVELYADYLEKYRNEQLKREDNYTAISIRKQGSTRNVMDEFDPASQDAAEINVFSKINSQFNKLIAAPKSKNFIERNPSYQLADGDFYNMKFASVQDRALNASVRESIIGPAVREMASMTSSSGAMKLFNTSSLDNTNSEALTFTLSNEIGAEYAYRSFDSPVIQTLKNVASPAIFGSVFEQFFKQSLPALLSTHVRVSMYNPRAFSATGRAMAYLASASTNKKAKDVITQIMNRSDVQQRDLIATVIDPIAQLSVIGSRINSGNTASKIFGAVKDGSEQARNLAMMPLRQGDRLAAQASFLAFLDEAYLSRYGKRFTYEQMLAAYDPELFAKASFELRSAQNVNSGKAMAQALRPGDNNASFIQSTLLSWASFAVNFKTGIYNDVANIADSKDSDSRKMAMASLTARVTEAVSYSAMLVYGLPILYSALASTLFGDDDEYTQGLDEFLQSEEKFKRFYSRIVAEVLPLTSNVPGFAPMSMLLGDIVLEGVNELYYNISPMKQEQGLTKKEAERIGLLPFKTYPTEAQDLLGKYTTSVQLAADSKEALSASFTGKYTDENGNSYYYDQAQREKLFKIGTVMGLASAGFSISEIKNAANASMRSVRVGKYKNEFQRYIQSDFTEDMPTDWMSDADRTTLELMKSGAALPADISSAIIGEPFKYSELYSKMQSVSPRAAGILLYNRLKDEPKSSQDSIVGEIAYRASTEDKNALTIFEEYMFEKNRVEKLGFSKEDIVEMAAGMQDKLDNTKQVLEKIDEKKVNKRLNELSDFLNTNLDKQ